MKLSEFRISVSEKLDKGREIGEEIEQNRTRMENATYSKEERYSDMEDAMELDEDYRPKGDIIAANDAFEQSKEEFAVAIDDLEASEESLKVINQEKYEMIDDLEQYAEEMQSSRERLQGVSGNKFSDTFKPLDETFSKHIEESLTLRDELLASMDEGTGGKQKAGALDTAGREEEWSSLSQMEKYAGNIEQTTSTGSSINENLSEEERKFREQFRKDQLEKLQQEIMDDPMTKNPLFSGVRDLPGHGKCLVFGINDERLGKLSYAQGNNTLGWQNDCSLAQIANLLTLSGKPTTEEEVVTYVNSIQHLLKSKVASSSEAKLNGGMIPKDISTVLNHFGLQNELYDREGDQNRTWFSLFSRKTARATINLDQIAEAVEEGKGVIMGLNSNYLNGIFHAAPYADHAISIVGTARDMRTHGVVGYYINDTGHPDVLTDGKLERSQTKLVPKWRLEQAFNVCNASAIVTTQKIR